MAIRRNIAPVDKESSVFAGARDEITAAVYTLFSQRFSSLIANNLANRVNRELSIRDQLSRETIRDIVNAIDVLEWRPLLIVARRALEKAAKEAALRSLWNVGIDEADPVAETALTQAKEWAKERSLELIGAKEEDGELVEDEESKNSIAKTTKEMLESSLQALADKDQPFPVILSAIPAIYALSAARAELIGKTEIDVAASKGQLISYGESGLVNGLRWVTKHDNRVEIHCADNERAGIVKLGTKFPSGHEYPPAHPRCRCSLAAVSVSE